MKSRALLHSTGAKFHAGFYHLCRPGLRTAAFRGGRLAVRRIGRPVKSAWRALVAQVKVPLLRGRLAVGVQPASNAWFERGMPVHRYYLAKFLERHASDIQGHCLEFQEDSYTSRFGGDRVTRLDIIHKERDAAAGQATIIADLTADNDIRSDAFDCIICTYVLHGVPELDRMISGLHRVLKPHGVLLVAVPNITIKYPQYAELWRFTADGLHYLLAKSFGPGQVQVSSWGNSLTAAGELRGLAVNDFASVELDFPDPRYGLVICARAIKNTSANT